MIANKEELLKQTQENLLEERVGLMKKHSKKNIHNDSNSDSDSDG